MRRLFIDMDEVLVDFVGGVCRFFNLKQEDVLSHWVPGEWSCVPPISRALGCFDPLLTPEEFWGRLEGNALFWSSLEPLPWCDELVSLLSSYTPDWYIVSSPTHCAGCHSGKVTWLKNYFGKTFDRFLLTPHKELLATPHSILLDDSDRNALKFRSAGGKAVLFPRHHNSAYPLCTQPPLPLVERALNHLWYNIKKAEVG